MPGPGEFEPASGIRSETPSRCAVPLRPRARPAAEKARRRFLRTASAAPRHAAKRAGSRGAKCGTRCITRASALAPPEAEPCARSAGPARPEGRAGACDAGRAHTIGAGRPRARAFRKGTSGKKSRRGLDGDAAKSAVEMSRRVTVEPDDVGLCSQSLRTTCPSASRPPPQATRCFHNAQ